MVSGKKLNTVPALSGGLKLEPSGYAQLSDLWTELSLPTAVALHLWRPLLWPRSCPESEPFTWLEPALPGAGSGSIK